MVVSQTSNEDLMVLQCYLSFPLKIEPLRLVLLRYLIQGLSDMTAKKKNQVKGEILIQNETNSVNMRNDDLSTQWFSVEVFKF